MTPARPDGPHTLSELDRLITEQPRRRRGRPRGSRSLTPYGDAKRAALDAHAAAMRERNAGSRQARQRQLAPLQHRTPDGRRFAPGFKEPHS